MDYYEYEFDSRDASASNNGSYTSLDTPSFLFSHNLGQILAVKVLEAQIPYTFYTINDDNNTFTVVENTAGLIKSFTVTIPNGSYTGYSFAPVSGALMTTRSAAVGDNNTYTSTAFDGASFKLNFVKTTKINYTFSITNVPSSLAKIIGIPYDITSAPGPSGHQYIYAPNVFTVPKFIYINSLTFGADVNLYLPENSAAAPGGGTGSQIAKVPFYPGPGGTMFWQDPCPEKWFNVENLNCLYKTDFFLTIDSDKPLKLNGESFSLKLGILAKSSASVEYKKRSIRYID